MSKYGLMVDINNIGHAAFDDNPREELARLLDETAKKVREGQTDGWLRDLNGNTVGDWGLELPDDDEEEKD